MEQNVAKAVEFGAWLGRGQAFAMVANLSLVAKAECLCNIRDSESYLLVCLTWEHFCTGFVGASRRHVGQIVHNLEEFGAACFRLSQIVKVSPEAYRQQHTRIEGEELEIGGERFALTPENAGSIGRAIQHMRAGLLTANTQTQAPPPAAGAVRGNRTARYLQACQPPDQPNLPVHPARLPRPARLSNALL
jgi:hypothetical protein